MSERKNQLNREKEDALIQRIGMHDMEAFETLYNMMNKPVFAYAFSILKNREDAEEVMQDCFLKIRAAAHMYKPQGKAQAWIFKIANNLCRMKLRSVPDIKKFQLRTQHFSWCLNQIRMLP